MLHSFVHFVSLVRNKEKNMDEYEHFLCVLTIVLFVLLLVRSLVAFVHGTMEFIYRYMRKAC